MGLWSGNRPICSCRTRFEAAEAVKGLKRELTSEAAKTEGRRDRKGERKPFLIFMSGLEPFEANGLEEPGGEDDDDDELNASDYALFDATFSGQEDEQNDEEEENEDGGDVYDDDYRTFDSELDLAFGGGHSRRKFSTDVLGHFSTASGTKLVENEAQEESDPESDEIHLAVQVELEKARLKEQEYAEAERVRREEQSRREKQASFAAREQSQSDKVLEHMVHEKIRLALKHNQSAQSLIRREAMRTEEKIRKVDHLISKLELSLEILTQGQRADNVRAEKDTRNNLLASAGFFPSPMLWARPFGTPYFALPSKRKGYGQSKLSPNPKQVPTSSISKAKCSPAFCPFPSNHCADHLAFRIA